jgi:SPP1 family phage portal protein
MNLFDNVKSFMSGPKGAMSDTQILELNYLEFNSSIQRRWMTIGERYYTGNNDIKFNSDLEDYESSETVDGKVSNKLAHGYMKLLVDEKVNYLLAKKYSLSCDNKPFLEAINKTLGKNFNYTMTRLGYEAANKGIGWLHAYINPMGALKFMVIPSEQCCPIWTDNSHTELEAMIRYYSAITYEGVKRKDVTKIEYWTANGLEYYEYRDGKLFTDVEAYMNYGIDRGGAAPHYSKNDEQRFWGMVPFIPFKNNMKEYPDVRFIKSLVDNYDDTRSEVANFIEEVKNLIYVLKGYGGADIKEFMTDLKKNRAIKIDDPADGGVDTINPTMDITAAQTHYEQLSKDIEKFGQSIPKDLEKLGNSPSGTALKFHYSGIDLKCNALESEFKFGFEAMLYFVRLYLVESDKGNFEDCDCEIVFNRDMAINTDAVIKNCVDSKDILSKETILSQHPFVGDVSAEMARIAKEKMPVME